MASLQILPASTMGDANVLLHAAPRRGDVRTTGGRDAGQGALDFLAMAAILVEPDRRVLRTNKAADAVLRRRDGLLLHKGILTCLQSASLQLLSAAVAVATAPYPRPSACLVERPGKPAGYRISASPTQQSGVGPAWLLLSDPEEEDASLTARLRAMFALTVAEAELAVALSQGHSLARIAVMRKVLPGTVRFQVKAIAAKMHCRRQVEIVAIVARLPALAWKKP